VAEARRLHDELGLARGPGTTSVRVNLLVIDTPFGPSAIEAHVDTSGGRFEIDTGHLTEADVTVSMGYETARAVFVSGDVQAVMQALMSGQIKVAGDLSKLLDPANGLWPRIPAGSPAQPQAEDQGQLALELAIRLQEITE